MRTGKVLENVNEFPFNGCQKRKIRRLNIFYYLNRLCMNGLILKITPYHIRLIHFFFFS